MQISRLPVPRCVIGEGPVWDVGEQALYLIDILGKLVLRYDPRTERSTTFAVPDIIGSMALTEGGAALVALTDGIHTLDLQTGACSRLALLEPPDDRVQLADGKVDRRGRFVVGTSHRQMKQPLGGLYSLGADHVLREIDHDIYLSNGPCWSPDNQTFYHSDSIRKSIYAYDYDLETGSISERRVFALTHALGGIPDGATVDAQGLMWMAICEGGKVVAFRPDGKLERIIEMPVACPSSVIFGGPDLDRLYVTTLNPSFLGRTAAPDDGCTFVIDGLGARGLPEPRYAG